MKDNMKTLFAVVAVALMMLVPASMAVGNDSDAAVIPAGSVPSGSDYAYVIKQASGATTTLADVVVASPSNTTGTSAYSDGPNKTGYTGSEFTINTALFSFSTTTGLGPFNSFYAAINLTSSTVDDAKETRINNQIGGIAYVLNPDDLTKTIQGTLYTPQLYNIMLVIPTVYWMVYEDSSHDTYLCMSNKKDFNFKTIATSGVAFATDGNFSATTFSSNAKAYAHTFSDSTVNDTLMPYIALGVYEGYKTNSTDTSSYGISANQLVSQADRKPTVSTTEASFRAAAKVGNNDNDDGTYMLWNYYQYTLYKMMAYTVMGNTNSQFIMGFGNVKLDNTDTVSPYTSMSTGIGGADTVSMTGQATKAYVGGTNSATNGAYVSMFLENAWGSAWEFIDDVAISNDANQYVYTNNRLSVSSGNLKLSELNSTNTAWIKSETSGNEIASFQTGANVWNLPATLGGSAATNVWSSSGDRATYLNTLSTASLPNCLSVGGNYNSALGAGVASVAGSNAVSSSGGSLGARLAYAMTADAAVNSTSSDTCSFDIDASNMVTVTDASGNEISDGESVAVGTKITVTLDSRIPDGETLVITSYAMLGSPIYFDSSSAIGDTRSFKVSADMFIYLETGMITSVTYNPDIYSSSGDLQEGQEAVFVQLSDSATSDVWATYRIADSHNNVIWSSSYHFTGDSLTIQQMKQTVSNLADNDTAVTYTDVQTATGLTEPTSGDWVAAAIAVSDTQSYLINKGEKIYGETDNDVWSAFTIDGEKTIEMYGGLIVTVTEVETNTNVYKIVPTGRAGTIYIPATHYKDWSAGTYYLSLQTENGYINVVNFPFTVGNYKITIAEDSVDYVSMVTVKGIERYTLQAGEVAQITLDSEAIAGLSGYHVFATYNDGMYELSEYRTGVYRFQMPAYNVVISLSMSADGYGIGLIYTYSTTATDLGYRMLLYSGAGTPIPAGTFSGDVYGVVAGKLYDGTEFKAVVCETLLSGEYIPEWMPDSDGGWIEIDVAAADTSEYYVATGDTVYYESSSGGYSAWTVSDDEPISPITGLTLSPTADGSGSKHYKITPTGVATKLFIQKQSQFVNAIQTGDARGTYDGTTWTPSDDGAWLAIAVPASDPSAYYVAKGDTVYYPNNSSGYSAWTVSATAPTDMIDSLVLTVAEEGANHYSITPSGVVTTIYIHYQSAYENAVQTGDNLGDYDTDGFTMNRSDLLTFTAGKYITALNQATAIVPSFTPAGSATVVGNQYFASRYTASADYGSITVDTSSKDVLFVMNDFDSNKAYSYTMTLYYNYDIETGLSTKTYLDSIDYSGTFTGPVASVSIDFDALGIDPDKVTVFSAKIGSYDALRVAI